MYQVEDEPIETIHLYVVREGERRPSIFPVILSLLALCALIAIGVNTPYTQPEQRASIRVPAVLLHLKTFSTVINIIPTGIKTYPATFAHGILTIANGSVVSQDLPAGIILTGNPGVSVKTDQAVFVPPGDANGYGIAIAPAHSLASGVNLSALSINQVIGTSLYVRNLRAFTGGHRAYSVPFATPQDKIRAVDKARKTLALQVIGLHYPCYETIKNVLTWRCQFVSYSVPSFMHVTSAQLQRNNVLVAVWYLERPRHIWMK